MNWLGLDIGGANLKAADGRGWARSVSFAVWREPNRLAAALDSLIEGGPAADGLAVTMTGELCDCFCSKADGVRHILSAVASVAQRRDVLVYLVDGRFVTIADATPLPHLAAASNWHALARFACRFVPTGSGLLIDIGSTTTDVIPIVNGEVAAAGRTDTERLLSRELQYRGIARTPICAVTNSLPWRGGSCPIAAELFATTADAYVLLGDLDEDPLADWTADARPLTRECARQRLARQLCADVADVSDEEFERIATAVRDAQIGELRSAIETVAGRMPEPVRAYVLSGGGEFAARAAVQRPPKSAQVISLGEEIGLTANRCAPAHALAVLVAEFYH